MCVRDNTVVASETPQNGQILTATVKFSTAVLKCRNGQENGYYVRVGRRRRTPRSRLEPPKPTPKARKAATAAERGCAEAVRVPSGNHPTTLSYHTTLLAKIDSTSRIQRVATFFSC